MLGLTALGGVGADADRLRDPPRLVVREAVSGLNRGAQTMYEVSPLYSAYCITARSAPVRRETRN